MNHAAPLVPAAELAKRNTMRFRNESDDYRRALPPGGAVTGNHRFQDEHGPVDFVGLFGDKQTLVVYSSMFGPQRVAPAVVTRLPIERVIVLKNQRGWRDLKRCSEIDGSYSRDDFGLGKMAATTQPSPCSPARTARSATSAAARWAWKPPIPARIRAARRTCYRRGLSSTSRPKAAAPTGIRNSMTPADTGLPVGRPCLTCQAGHGHREPRKSTPNRHFDARSGRGITLAHPDGEISLAKPNYSFEKRQREIAKKKQQEEKDARKREARDAAKPAPAAGADSAPGEHPGTKGL
jgi:hypothetical protein